MTKTTCTVEGCDQPLHGRGMCNLHCRRQRKGIPLNVPPLRIHRVPPGTICKVPGCDRDDRIRLGWCDTHYARYRATGDVQPDKPIEVNRQDGQCRVPECIRPAFCKDLCTLHYQRLDKTGTTDPRPKAVCGICSIADCAKPVLARTWCSGHYQRNAEFGDPLGGNPKISKAARGLCRASRCVEPIHAERRCIDHFLQWAAFQQLCDRAATVGQLDDADQLLAIGRVFEARIRKPHGETGCWIWIGYVNPAGYGLCPMGKRQYRIAHRVSWALVGRRFVAGWHLDHLCHTNDKTCTGGPTCLHRRCVNPQHLEQVTPGVNVIRGVSPSAINARKTHCKQGHEFDLLNTYFSRVGTRYCRTCRRTVARQRYRDRKAAMAA